MLLIVLAALLSQPQRLNSHDWFSPDDMPARVQKAGITRSVVLRIAVRPDGSVRSCEVQSASGDPALDMHTCSLIVKRAKYAPAKWVDGSAAYGVDRLAFVWAVGAPPGPSTEPGDLTLTVKELPKRAKSPTHVHVAVAVDQSGIPVGCNEPREPTGRFSILQEHLRQLVPLACGQVMKLHKAQPAQDGAEKTVPSVQLVTVRFRSP